MQDEGHMGGFKHGHLLGPQCCDGVIGGMRCFQVLMIGAKKRPSVPQERQSTTRCGAVRQRFICRPPAAL